MPGSVGKRRSLGVTYDPLPSIYGKKGSDMTGTQDDLTLVYMFGYKNGKDSLKAEIERLLLIEQGAANLCDKCGWRMKFPNKECRNCENAKLRDEIERLRAALLEIIQKDAFTGETVFVGDYGKIARTALEGEKKDD
jgi:hypothetical protein